MMDRKQLLSAIVGFSLISSVTVASNNAGAFIEKGLSARAAGMGMAFVSQAENSSAIYWNPAGLAYLETHDLQILGTTAIETRYLSIQSAYSWAGLNWGIGAITATMDNIDETRKVAGGSTYEKTGRRLSYNAAAYFLSAGTQLWEGLAVGATAKVIQEKAAGNQGSALGVDAGAMWDVHDDVRFGLNLQNVVAPQVNWNTPSKNVDGIPLNVKAGLGVSFLDDTLLTTLDVNMRKNRKSKLNAGLEYWLAEAFALRAGIEDSILTLGTGLYLEPFYVNVAWTSPSLDQVNDIYRFSLGLTF